MAQRPHVGGQYPDLLSRGWAGVLTFGPRAFKAILGYHVFQRVSMCSAAGLNVNKQERIGKKNQFPPGFREMLGYHGNQLVNLGVCSKILPSKTADIR
jgi:hypothetical protein